MELPVLSRDELKVLAARNVLHALVDEFLPSTQRAGGHELVRELSDSELLARLTSLRDESLAALEDLCGPIFESAGRLMSRFRRHAVPVEQGLAEPPAADVPRPRPRRSS